MFDDPTNPSTLRPQELEAVYAISQAIATSVDMDTALDHIIQLARPVFIFDNMVLHLTGDEVNLEPTYARAIGRGRAQEAELTWGENSAHESILTGKAVIGEDELENLDDRNRNRYRYSLALPLRVANRLRGALVFIRIGGPSYQPDQIRLAEFIAIHVGQLLEHDQLVQKVVALEAERRLSRLQEDFIATVSHELLTPLGFIKGYATTLLRQDTTWDDATRREFLTIIDEESDRLRELIDNLMDSSRLQAGTLRMSFQPVRLEAFLNDMSARARARDDNPDVLVVSGEPGMKIFIDPTRLAQVFDNLLTNAAKYAPGASIRITLTAEGPFAHIAVEDNGPGIAQEHLSNLFKRFYRVPTNNTTLRGTGLGLFICRQIVRAHGGEIRVESTPGVGTAFHIHLPLEQGGAKQEHISLREISG